MKRIICIQCCFFVSSSIFLLHAAEWMVSLGGPTCSGGAQCSIRLLLNTTCVSMLLTPTILRISNFGEKRGSMVGPLLLPQTAPSPNCPPSNIKVQTGGWALCAQSSLSSLWLTESKQRLTNCCRRPHVVCACVCLCVQQRAAEEEESVFKCFCAT